MPNFLSIVDFVSRARHVFEQHGALFSYARFPAGSCGPASEILGRCIEEQFSVLPELVEGTGRPDRQDVSHAWLAFDDLVVDVTHDQFEASGLEPGRWVFARPSKWHANFCFLSRRPLISKSELLANGFGELYRLTTNCGRLSRCCK